MGVASGAAEGGGGMTGKKPLWPRQALMRAVAELPEKDSSMVAVVSMVADHMHDRSDEAWPSIEMLMGETGLGRTQVKKHLKAAVAGGLIEKRGRVRLSEGRGSGPVRYGLGPVAEARRYRDCPEARPTVGPPTFEGADQQSVSDDQQSVSGTTNSRPTDHEQRSEQRTPTPGGDDSTIEDPEHVAADLVRIVDDNATPSTDLIAVVGDCLDEGLTSTRLVSHVRDAVNGSNVAHADRWTPTVVRSLRDKHRKQRREQDDLRARQNAQIAEQHEKARLEAKEAVSKDAGMAEIQRIRKQLAESN